MHLSRKSRRLINRVALFLFYIVGFGLTVYGLAYLLFHDSPSPSTSLSPASARYATFAGLVMIGQLAASFLARSCCTLVVYSFWMAMKRVPTKFVYYIEAVSDPIVWFVYSLVLLTAFHALFGLTVIGDVADDADDAAPLHHLSPVARTWCTRALLLLITRSLGQVVTSLTVKAVLTQFYSKSFWQSMKDQLLREFELQLLASKCPHDERGKKLPKLSAASVAQARSAAHTVARTAATEEVIRARLGCVGC